MNYVRQAPAEAPAEFDPAGVFHALPGATFWGEPLPTLTYAKGKPDGVTDPGWWTQERGKRLAMWLDEPRLRWLAEVLMHPHLATRYVEGSIQAQTAAAAWKRAQDAGHKIEPEALRMPDPTTLDRDRVNSGVRRIHVVAAMVGQPSRPPVSLTAYALQRLTVVEAITAQRLWPQGLSPYVLALVPEVRQVTDQEARMRKAEGVFR